MELALAVLSDPEPFFAMIAILVMGFIYVIPIMVAWNKRQLGSIAALDLLLGWTLIGWVVALCWALMVEDSPPTIQQTAAANPPPAKLCARCGRYSPADAGFCSSCGDSFRAPHGASDSHGMRPPQGPMN